jgi:TPR repeat protein
MKRLLVAAEKGDAGSQFNLAVLYDNRLDDNGHSIGGNRAEALKWLLQAAEQGLPRAQTKLAEMYAEDADASGDHVKACTWYIVATANLSGAQRHRAQAGYERIAREMTAAQIAEAAKRARAWKAKPQANPAADRIRDRSHRKRRAS